MIHQIIRLFKFFSVPICKELPFFIFCSLTSCVITGISLYVNGMPTNNTITGTVLGFVVALLWAYLITSLVVLCRKRLVKVILYFLLSIYFIINLFLFYNYGITISPSILTVIAETNSQEVSDFFSAFLTNRPSIIAYSIGLSTIVIAVNAELLFKKVSKWMTHKTPTYVASAIAIAILAVGIPSACNIYIPLAQCQSPDDISQWRFNTFVRPADTFTDLIYSVDDIWLASSNTRKAIAANQAITREPISCTESDSLSLIVVIGESYIKSHCQLYGYCLATTPYLKNELDSGRLYVFQDAVSPYNMTSDVIKNSFSCNSMGAHEHWYDKPTFPAIFKKSGYYVTFWDNQRQFDAQKEYTFALNSFLYDDQICRASYDETNKKTFKFDHQLVESFQKEASHDKFHELALIHLMGQHFTASNRYPRSRRFSPFRSDSIKRNESYLTRQKKYQIACYDNATFYNDHVMGLIINAYKNKNAVVVYFADHGEEIYDYRDFKGREHGTLTPQALKYQFDIPFIIWTSDRYKATHAEVCADLARSLHQPMMLDNVCQILFRLGGVNTTLYQAQRDVTSPLYQPQKRLIRNQFYYEDLIKKK